jgi:LysM repeat protein
MPLPSLDELRERLAACYEAAGVTATDAYHRLRRVFEERPALGRALGGGAAVVVFAGVAVGVVIEQQAGPQTSGGGQLLVPAVTATPRADEHNGLLAAPTHSPTPAHSATPAHPGPPAHPVASGRPGPPEPGRAAHAEAGTPHRPAGAAAPHQPERAAAPAEHRVHTGETLAMVALRYGVPFEQIASDSGVADPNRLRPGQRLVIRAKPADVEVIQPGRTLGDYARSTGRRVAELMRLNPQLVDPDRIIAGGRLDV